MNRRGFLRTVAGTVAVGMAGCLSDTEYQVETASVQSSPGPLSLALSVLDAGATIEGPATLEFTLSNPTERAVRVRNIGVWPFGVLSLTPSSSSTSPPSTSGGEPPITLYSEAYNQTDRVDVGPNRMSMGVQGGPIIRSVKPSESIAVRYELYGDEVYNGGTYRVMGWSNQSVLSYMMRGDQWTRYMPQVDVTITKKSRIPV